jgi:hypothetical protein
MIGPGGDQPEIRRPAIAPTPFRLSTMNAWVAAAGREPGDSSFQASDLAPPRSVPLHRTIA